VTFDGTGQVYPDHVSIELLLSDDQRDQSPASLATAIELCLAKSLAVPLPKGMRSATEVEIAAAIHDSARIIRAASHATAVVSSGHDATIVVTDALRQALGD
jgi:hypothetical protein